MTQPRRTSELLRSALDVIDLAFAKGADVMAPMVSGGHDSLSALYVAAQHSKFANMIYHINTGIGARATQQHVKDVCAENGWQYEILKSPETFEMFVRDRGFPGPGMHQWAYVRLKERCVRMIMRKYKPERVALITGCRAQESARRMGHVEPLKIGEVQRRRKTERVQVVVKGKLCWRKRKIEPAEYEEFLAERRRFWVAPCHDWSEEEQAQFMVDFDIPKNPIKLTPLGMSGECFCGAFARPNEIALIRRWAPDVAQEIDRLTIIAHQLGTHEVWGTRPDKRTGIVVAKSGPLCNSCDARAMAAGLIVDQTMQCDIREEVNA